MTALAIPTIPALNAGHVVTLSEMQQLCSAANFLLSPPMTMVLDETGAQAIGLIGSPTTITFTNDLKDVDGAWSSGSPSRLTIQTPGWYKVRYVVNCLQVGSASPYCTYLTSTTGSNNPAGAGVVSSKYWGGYSVGIAGDHCYPGAAGIWPAYLYSGDYLQLFVYGNATGSSTSNAGPAGGTTNGSFLEIEYVSTV